MKLLGRDISGRELLEELEARLRARGLMPPARAEEPRPEGVEPRVDPLTFNVGALDAHVDPSRPMPLQTHRGGLSGKLLLLTKQVLQQGGQILLKEALGRQRTFNGHVRDSYAQLSAEVLLLRSQVEALKAAGTRAATSPPHQPGKSPRKKSPGRKPKR
ncbi:MAG: hypothetical protein M3Y59_07995 [Myxococcota bacterium]|nr:hypothetical protein [Myxococcota bacterium]